MADANGSLDIFILSGQSNMSGRGGNQVKIAADGSTYKVWDGVVPAECDADKGSILRLAASLEWEEAHEPLHIDIDKGTCGVGPGLVFAASVIRSRKAKGKKLTIPAIGLVPCADGGTSMADWKKGGFLYNRMIERTKAATDNGGTLRALLWYQGESDTTSAEAGEKFQQRLETFLDDVRLDLMSQDLPIIQVGITWEKHEHPEILEQVRQAQRAVADKVDHVYLVDAYGLPLQYDNVHLSTEGQTKLGQMLAEKYDMITGK